MCITISFIIIAFYCFKFDRYRLLTELRAQKVSTNYTRERCIIFSARVKLFMRASVVGINW